MAWSSRRTQMRWPRWTYFLTMACVLVFLPFIIAALVVLGLIPLYLSNQSAVRTATQTVSSLKVAYILVDQSTRFLTGIDLQSVDRVSMARDFENCLGIRIPDVLQIGSISLDTALTNSSVNRRKRFIRCDRNVDGASGPVLVFDFNLTYPIHRLCQTQECVDKTFGEIYQQFQSVSELSINFNNINTQLRLCSMNPVSLTDLGFTNNASMTSTITVTTTTVKATAAVLSVTTLAINTTGSGTTVTTSAALSVGSVTTLATNTTRSGTTVTTSMGSVTLTTTSAIAPTAMVTTSATTITSLMTQATSIASSSTASESSSATTTMTDMPPTTAANLTTIMPLNGTTVDLETCLAKIPFTQEKVPPYAITHTSTIFARDGQTVLIVGAFKIDSFYDLQSIERRIIIDGVMVYRNCQRTIDVSVPVIYNNCIGF